MSACIDERTDFTTHFLTILVGHRRRGRDRFFHRQPPYHDHDPARDPPRATCSE